MTTARLLAVAGDPVAHSLSPAMHNAAIAALGLEAVYVAARTTERALPALVQSMLEAGGALNVTVPFKRAAAGLVAHPTGVVERTGACNTIWGEPAAPSGDNTDVAGVRVEARTLTRNELVKRVLVVGTGGSARAAAVAIADEWPAAVVEVLSRDRARAEQFASWAHGAGVTAEPHTGSSTADLIINTTPLGLRGDDPLPVSREVLSMMRARAVLDLVYARGETALVREARSLGLAAADGRGVLVEQGAMAFERFFGVKPPVSVMRAAVEDALRS